MQLTRRHAQQQDGFTLVEMIVAMILVAGLLIVISTVLLRTFGESARSREERTAIQAARSTFNAFGSDIRAAQAPDRDARFVGNADELTGALLKDEAINLQLPGQPAPIRLDVRDILEATSSSVMFRADAAPTAGVECVRYWVRPTDRAFLRTVHRYNATMRACDTTSAVSEKVMMEVVQ